MFRIIITAGLFFTLLLGGCISSRKIAVEISFPPRIPVRENIKELSLVVIVPDKLKKDGGGNISPCRLPDDPECRLLAAEKALLGFSEKIYEESDLEVKGIVEWVDTGNMQHDTLTDNYLLAGPARLCTEKDSTGLLIILGPVRLKNDITFSQYKRWPHEARNKIWSKTILYSVEPVWMQQTNIRMTVNNPWYIYDCSAKQIIFEEAIEDSVHYKVDGATREEVEKKLPSLRTTVEKAGFVSGWDFAGWLLPSSSTVLRKYYGSRRPLLRQATREVMFRQWERAEQEWLKALNTAAGSKKGRILYNLALARERAGDYAKALKYITEAEKLFPSAEVKAYHRILEREKENRGK
jgi:hypothetical protein